MNIVKQISSLEKVRQSSALDYEQITHAKVLQGERYTYQIAVRSDAGVMGHVQIESPLSEHVRVYVVRQSVMDTVTTEPVCELDYVTNTPGLMPDLLVPLEQEKGCFQISAQARSLWIEVNVPRDLTPGRYGITCRMTRERSYPDDMTPVTEFEKTMTLEVLDLAVKEQSLIYTRWFYADCIANYHNVPIYSDAHFDLIEAYIREAVDVGINMILVPIHTPPLDTQIGTYRPCVQLVDITKAGDVYTFGFDKLRRFVDICKRCGVQYYEMAHMFSQWGAKCAANIMVEENGKKDYMFGWHVASTDARYVEFLKQYIAALSGELSTLGISENTYFHISDEPSLDNIEAYKTASDIIKPLIGKSRTFDALSKYEFYEQGLVECPVTSVGHIHDFLGHGVPDQWAYYCCGPQRVGTNSFIGMASCRTRILGILLYKYNIKGFLHWGLNFYNSALSRYPIDPYTTTSGDGSWPSGDPFILYPHATGAYPCIRGKITREAIGDMDLCRTLEEYIGRDAVVRMIDEMAGFDVRFDCYPRDKDYLLNLRRSMLDALQEKAQKA